MLGLSSITATSSISALSLSLSGLKVILASVFGIPWLIAAAFVAAGLLVWKFWEPIKAFSLVYLMEFFAVFRLLFSHFLFISGL